MTNDEAAIFLEFFESQRAATNTYDIRAKSAEQIVLCKRTFILSSSSCSFCSDGN